MTNFLFTKNIIFGEYNGNNIIVVLYMRKRKRVLNWK